MIQIRLRQVSNDAVPTQKLLDDRELYEGALRHQTWFKLYVVPSSWLMRCPFPLDTPLCCFNVQSRFKVKKKKSQKKEKNRTLKKKKKKIKKIVWFFLETSRWRK